jgi:hypothetical protein
MHCIGVIKNKEEKLRTKSAGCLVVCCLVNLTKNGCLREEVLCNPEIQRCLSLYSKRILFLSLYQFSFDKWKKQTSKTQLLVVF